VVISHTQSMVISRNQSVVISHNQSVVISHDQSVVIGRNQSAFRYLSGAIRFNLPWQSPKTRPLRELTSSADVQ